MLEIFGHFIGLVGMAFVVLAYLAIERKWLDANNIKLYLVNLLGAVLLIISLVINFNLGSFIIEIFWIAISLNGIWHWYKRNYIGRLTNP